MYLIAEHCDADFYTGWHLYLRETPKYQTPNSNGSWGWIRSGDLIAPRIIEFMASLGINLFGDWTCPEYGLAEFVKRYPLSGRRIWGEKRGGVEVLQDRWGTLDLYTPTQ